MKAKVEIFFTRTEKEPDFIFGNFIPIEMLLIMPENFQFQNNQSPGVVYPHSSNTMATVSWEISIHIQVILCLSEEYNCYSEKYLVC